MLLSKLCQHIHLLVCLRRNTMHFELVFWYYGTYLRLSSHALCFVLLYELYSRTIGARPRTVPSHELAGIRLVIDLAINFALHTAEGAYR